MLYSPYDLMSGVNRESNAYAKGLVDTDALRCDQYHHLCLSHWPLAARQLVHDAVIEATAAGYSERDP